VESVPAFLDALARRLVPACDPGVVQAVFARASAGYAGPRGRDGHRVTAITPSGVPFEASVTGGAGRSSAALRYVTEAATALPFFRPRLAAQRAAVDDLAAWLPGQARSAAPDLRAFVDALFPDPALVPARTRFATAFGIVQRPEVPDGVAGLKVYGNLAVDPAALARLAARWPPFAALADPVDGLTFVVPHFATVEVDVSGGLAHKVYFRTRRANGAAIALLARRVGADVGELAGELDRAGVGSTVWRGRIYVCCGAAPSAEPEISVHLPAKALGLPADGMASLARRLATAHGGRGAPAALAALEAAAERSGGATAWATTVVGVGLPAGGGIGKVNVYVAPLAPASPAADGTGERPQAFSNSAWMGSRVTS
jgi:hypothetical protein